MRSFDSPVPWTVLPAALAMLSLAGPAAAEGFSFEPRGRIQIDLQHRDWRTLAEDDTDLYVRRLYLGAQGVIAGNWRYKADLVLTPGIEAVGVDDAFIEYRADGWSLFIGEHNVTSPLEERTSSLDMPFIERSALINAFGYGRRAGLGYLAGGERWSLALAAQGGSMNAADGEGDADESRALSARFTFAPVLGEGLVLHLGAHARQRYQNDANQRVRARPLNGRDTRWIDATSAGANRIAEDDAFGGEAVYVRGPFSVQGEYAVLNGQTPSGASRDFTAYYLDVSWSITGESRPYAAEKGVFEAIEPRSPLGQGGFGHWALSARYDYADLSDGPDVQRGEQQAYAIGVDWVPGEHWRFKLNLARSEMDRSIGPDDEADIVSLRAQYAF